MEGSKYCAICQEREQERHQELQTNSLAINYEHQPTEQAGFRSKYSTTNHIHVINRLKAKCCEYNIPLCVAFVDYEKAFDSVQTQAILASLQKQGLADVYIEVRACPKRHIYGQFSDSTSAQRE